MSVLSPALGLRSALPPLPIYRFTVDQYHRMVAAGILDQEDPLELLEGLIVIKGNGTLAPRIEVRSENGRGSGLPLSLYRFTVPSYRALFSAGILPEDAPVELLEGWLVQKMPRNPPHDSAVYRTQQILFRRLPDDWICRGQSGMVTDTSQPEPDLAIVRGPAERYDERHPTPEDTAVVVEVADSTLASDRTLKAALYARVNISIYWIVNIIDRQVEVYTDPTGPIPEPAYRQRQDYRVGDAVSLILDGREIAQVLVENLLPRAADEPPS